MVVPHKKEIQMSKSRIFGFLVAFFSAVATIFLVGVAHAQSTPLTFIANHAELYAALDAAEQGTIGSVAISEEYFKKGTSRIQKNQIHGLIARTFESGDRTVFFYGHPLDTALVKELLGGGLAACSSAYAIGKTLYKGRAITASSVCFNVLEGGVTSEKTMRDNLRQYVSESGKAR